MNLHPCQEIPDKENEYWVQVEGGLWIVRPKQHAINEVEMAMEKLKKKIGHES